MAKRHNKKRTMIAWVTVLVILVVVAMVGMLIWNNVRQNNDADGDTEASEVEENVTEGKKGIYEDEDKET